MIQRYKIEDLVIQDATGVVFKAFDEETGLAVSVRRFFPYGMDGGGLNADKQSDYNDCIARFTEIKHPALASVIEGGCDPVDGMPYLVTEWLEGTTLETLLESRPLSQPEAMAVIIPLMEVCQLLSHTIGYQGIWVQTQFDTITLDTGHAHRPVIFQVTPLKCIGDFDGHSSLLPLVELTARITGWHQGVPAHLSATGLGAWLNWLYGVCERTSLQEARENLAVATGVSLPSPEVPKTRAMTRPGPNSSTVPIESTITVTRPKSALIPWLISGFALVGLSIGGWFLFHQNGISLTKTEESAPSSIIVKTIDPLVVDSPPTPLATSEQLPTEVIRPKTPPEIDASISPTPAPIQAKAVVNKPVVPSPPAKPVRPPTKPQTKPPSKPVNPPAKSVTNPPAAPTNPPAKPVSPPGAPVFNAADQKILQGQEGKQIAVEGTVEEVVSSNSGDTLYLVFIKNKGPSTFRVGVSKKDAKGDLASDELKALIGKKVRTTGKIIIETPSRPVIRITNRSAIQPAK